MQVLSVPIFITYLGVDMYGEYILLLTIPGFLVLGEVGFNAVVNNEIVFKIANKNYDEANRLISSSVFILFFSYNLVALIVFFLTIYFQNNYNYVSHSSIILLYFIFWLGGFISILFGIFQSYLRAQDFHHHNILWVGITRLLEILIPLLLVFYTRDLLILFISSFIIKFFSFVSYINFIKLKVSWFKFKIYYSNNFKIFKPYFNKSLLYFLFSFGQGLIIQGSTYIVGYKLGSKNVVIFNTVRTLINFSKMLLNLINNSFLSEFTKIYANGNKNLLKQTFNLSLQLTLISVLISSTILLFFGQEIITIWTNYEINVDIIFLSLMIVEAILYSVWFIKSNLIVSCNFHKEISISFALSSILFFVLLFMSIDNFNLNSVPLSLSILNILMIYSVNKSLKFNFGFSNNLLKLLNFKKGINFIKNLKK